MESQADKINVLGELLFDIYEKMETKCTDRQANCDHRFDAVENKIGWARTGLISVLTFLAGMGLLNGKTVLAWVAKLSP